VAPGSISNPRQIVEAALLEVGAPADAVARPSLLARQGQLLHERGQSVGMTCLLSDSMRADKPATVKASRRVMPSSSTRLGFAAVSVDICFSIMACDCATSRLKRPGVTPKICLKARVKASWDSNPQSKASSARAGGRSPSRRAAA
jgi:hypothetical protein